MRINAIIAYEDGGEPWVEPFDSGGDDPQEYMEFIVSKFNRTLRPGEKRRKLVSWERDSKTVVWFIEDEEESRTQFARDILEELPDIALVMFDSAMSLVKATGSPDIIIIDVAGASGGVCLSVGCSWAGMISPIKSVVEKHPGANFGFFSVVNNYAADIVEEFEEDNPEMVAEFIDSWESKNFISFIKKWSV